MTLRTPALLFSVLAPAAAGASPSRPALALTATPAHVTLLGSARQTIRVVNRGTEPLVVDAAAAGLTLGLRGAPRALLRGAAARRAASWLRISPTRVELHGGASAEVALTSSRPHAAAPGDHVALVLLTTRAARGAPVGVRMRIGVTVVVHVPGRTRHALVLRAFHLRKVGERRVFRLRLANAGNVVESLRRGGVEVAIVAQGRVVASLRSAARELLPHSAGIVELLYRGDLRGPVTVHVAVTPRAGPALRRSFRVRL